MAKENEHKQQRKNRLLLGTVISLIVLILLVILGYLYASNPRRQTKKEAIAIAAEVAQINQVDHFYWFARQDVSFTVVGENEQGQTLAVMIPETGQKATVIALDTGISEEQLRQYMQTTYQVKQIKKINLGLYNDQPTWEVVAQMPNGTWTYYLLAFETAEEQLVIENF